MALPNGPRIDAARASMEPGGRSGRSSHQGGSVAAPRAREHAPEHDADDDRDEEATHCGRRADASGPSRSASGARAVGRRGEWIAYYGGTDTVPFLAGCVAGGVYQRRKRVSR